MSIEDTDYTNYYDSTEESVETPSVDPNKIDELQKQVQQSTEQIQGLQNWWSQSPLAPQPTEKEIEAQKAQQYLQNWAKEQGFITKQDFEQQQRDYIANTYAQEQGYVHLNHLMSDYQNTYFANQNDQQKRAELDAIGQLYNQNPRQAIERFKQFKSQGSVPTQNQAFGHAPTQTRQEQGLPRFSNAREFVNWGVQNPSEYQQVMQDWQAGKIKAPY